MRTNVFRNAQQGMSLIELMIVVGIVAILGTIALANYRSYALRANRAEAKSALLRIQAAQERYYLNAHTYTNNLSLLGAGGTTERQLYTLRLQNVSTTTFTAIATAVGDQVADAECPTFSIDEAGTRQPALGTNNKCWQ